MGPYPSHLSWVAEPTGVRDMFTDPLLQYQLNRMRHDELVREANRERLAGQIRSTARSAPAILSTLRCLAALPAVLRRPLRGRASAAG